MSTSSKSEAGEKNDGGNAEQLERPETPDIECPICFEEITDACRTNKCRHLFCRKCLRQWSTIKSYCPMCMTNFTSIIDLPTTERIFGLNASLGDVETIVLDSDVEENIETDARRTPPRVVVLNYPSDDSDVKFIGIFPARVSTSRPIETNEPCFAGQPSTSTANQHSVEPPNNHFMKRFFKARRIRNMNYSSSSKSFTSNVPTVRRMVCEKRKQDNETNISKKQKKSIGIKQDIIQRRSYSESSSSDEEDD